MFLVICNSSLYNVMVWIFFSVDWLHRGTACEASPCQVVNVEAPDHSPTTCQWKDRLRHTSNRPASFRENQDAGDEFTSWFCKNVSKSMVCLMSSLLHRNKNCLVIAAVNVSHHSYDEVLYILGQITKPGNASLKCLS